MNDFMAETAAAEQRSLTVLIVGSGGREHALAEAVGSSQMLKRLYVAPGNAGTAEHNVSLDLTAPGHAEVTAFCQANEVDLVIVGPEGPLVAGLADALSDIGIACLGPSAAAAQLEGSKAFARDFAARHGIPGPVTEAFTEVKDAVAWMDDFDGAVVVKADGLASGKGVIIPERRVDAERAVFDLLADKTMGDAGNTVVIEQRIEGEEISLFGLADGAGVISLGMAQDHKRVGEGDTGLNTGGMGAFSPVPGFAEMEEGLVQQFLVPAVAGMATEGTPYVGILYAGIMLTADGPQLIEYNCRFGDPEAQVILPLIGSDVLELLWNAATGRLSETRLSIIPETTAATVVVAAAGYPTSPATGIEVPDISVPDGVRVLHNSTTIEDGTVVNAGGRVLSVTGTGANLEVALDSVYEAVDQLVSVQLFARSDIGWRHAPSRAAGDAYSRAGVSFAAAKATTDRIARAVSSTHDDRVVSGLGSFGGVFDLSSLGALEQPLMVASTDGVGTKTILAAEMDSWESIGHDIVNHGINDVLVQGAHPLFFLDTIAAASLSPEIVERILGGMAEACRAANCVLLGGETAEMPDVLTAGSVDVAGTMVGVVERAKLLPRASVAPGHLLLGLSSSGLHTNGYSLARKAVAQMNLSDPLPNGGGVTIGEALVAPHRSYLGALEKALSAELIEAMAHITGGGLIDNLPRVLPDGCGAVIDADSWTWPPLFAFLVELGGLNKMEAHQIFNLGIGMVLVVEPDRLDETQQAIAEPTKVIGRVVNGAGVSLT